MSEVAEQSVVYTIEQICARYQISQQTVWRLTRKGKLPQPLRIGKVRRYPARDTDEAFAKMQGRGV